MRWLACVAMRIIAGLCFIVTDSLKDCMLDRVLRNATIIVGTGYSIKVSGDGDVLACLPLLEWLRHTDATNTGRTVTAAHSIQTFKTFSLSCLLKELFPILILISLSIFFKTEVTVGVLVDIESCGLHCRNYLINR